MSPPSRPKFEAIGVLPGKEGFRRLDRELEAPHPRAVDCEVLAVGCCVTDHLVMRGRYGEAPPGLTDLVTGHEVVVRTLDVPGDAVNGIRPGATYALKVREPEPDAPAWVARDPDLADDHYRDRGLRRLDGGLRARLLCDFGSMVEVPGDITPLQAVFVEPASCICKAYRLVTSCRTAVVGEREDILPRRALVLGAGSTGLLATALFRLNGYEVVTLDLVSPDSTKAELARAFGAEYRQSEPGQSDLALDLARERGPLRYLFDTTGAPEELYRFEPLLGPTGAALEFGLPDRPCCPGLDLAPPMTRRVLGTRLRIGSVNAGREDWPAALELVGAVAQRWPEFFTRSIARIDGLDIAPMVEAIEDPAVIKAAVVPAGGR